MMRVYQTTILIPYLIAITVVAYLGYAFLSTDTGFINKSILAPLGLEPISFYSNCWLLARHLDLHLSCGRTSATTPFSTTQPSSALTIPTTRPL